jgi:outer membrane protein OmpA-like peptidoglycan-associated protein
MRSTFIAAGGAFALVTAVCGTARGQETGPSYLREHLPAPTNALELKVGTGYTQGFGNLAPGHRIADMSGGGLGASLELDGRLTPRWSIGVEGQYQELSHERDASARGLVVNAGATYHFAPVLRGDPWLRLGAGFRWLSEKETSAAGAIDRYGFEPLSGKLGYDIRFAPGVAIAPVVGADVNLFTWEDTTLGSHALTTAQVGTFVYAGLQGRFDLGGTTQDTAVASLQAPVTVTSTFVTPPPPFTPPPPSSPPNAAEAPKPYEGLTVSDEMLRACKLNLDRADRAPKFAFDKSIILPSDDFVLSQIADCLVTGPLKDKSVVLVGHGDPRGTQDYNDSLGKRRANAVAAYFREHGVSSARIEEKSRGKLDATGHGPAGWAEDRRVDVLLQER